LETDVKIIITGGRHADLKTIQPLVWSWLDNLVVHMATPEELRIAQGGASGVDKFAREWCMRRGIDFANYPYLTEFGRAGGRMRNEVMLRDFRPHCVVAFPGGAGTRHMTNIARRDEVLVVEVKSEVEIINGFETRRTKYES
jgi:hypothetical protein